MLDFAVLDWKTGARCNVEGTQYGEGFPVRPFINTGGGGVTSFAAGPKLELIDDAYRFYEIDPSDIADGDVNGDAWIRLTDTERDPNSNQAPIRSCSTVRRAPTSRASASSSIQTSFNKAGGHDVIPFEQGSAANLDAAWPGIYRHSGEHFLVRFRGKHEHLFATPDAGQLSL